MLTLSALFAEMLSVIAVDDIAYQQQRERYKKYDGRKSVHLRCDRLFCHAVYTDGQRFKSVAGCEIADNKVVERQRECHYSTGHDSRKYLRQLDLEKRPHGSAAEVHCCLGKRIIHLSELRQHLQYNIRRAECNVCDKHRSEA